jgi:hypothetical protein
VAEGGNILSFSAVSGAFLNSFNASLGGALPVTIAFDALGAMYVLAMSGQQGTILKFSGTSGQPSGAGGNTSNPTLVPLGASALYSFGGLCVATDPLTQVTTVYASSAILNSDGTLDLGGGLVMTFDGSSGQFISVLVPNGSNGLIQPRAMMLTITFTPTYPFPVGPDNGDSGAPSPFWRRILATILRFIRIFLPARPSP